MKSIIKVIIAVFLMSSAQASLGCDYPPKADVADGLSATKEDMLGSQRAVTKYVADMEVYLECIVTEEKASLAQDQSIEPEDEQLREDMLNKKYNAAVDEMERVAAEYNAAVQAYLGRDD